MREIRQSGSEGGGALTGPPYPYTVRSRFAAAEAAATTPASVASDRETRTSCCGRLRGRTSPPDLNPAQSAGLICASAPPRATLTVACRASSLLVPRHPRKNLRVARRNYWLVVQRSQSSVILSLPKAPTLRAMLADMRVAPEDGSG